MSTSKQAVAGSAGAVAVAVAGRGGFAAAAGATWTSTLDDLRSTPTATSARSESSNSERRRDRQVVLKQKGYGVLGRTIRREGRWKIDPEDIHYKGPLPYKIYAEVKATRQMLRATSKTIDNRLAADPQGADGPGCGRDRQRRLRRVRAPTLSSGPAPSRRAWVRVAPLP